MKYLLFVCLLLSQTTNAQMSAHWRQISGPAQTIIAHPDSASTLVTGLNKIGIYRYEFSVTNMFGTGRDTCTVTVIGGSLSINPDSNYYFQRPPIQKLAIKMMVRGNEIFIQIKSPKVQTISCVLYDFLGRKLAKIDMEVMEGTNIMKVPKPLMRGVYILRFETYYDVITQKIMI